MAYHINCPKIGIFFFQISIQPRNLTRCPWKKDLFPCIQFCFACLYVCSTALWTYFDPWSRHNWLASSIPTKWAIGCPPSKSSAAPYTTPSFFKKYVATAEKTPPEADFQAAAAFYLLPYKHESVHAMKCHLIRAHFLHAPHETQRLESTTG